jgi:hypothetical protein
MCEDKNKKIGREKISQGFFLGDTSGRTRNMKEKSVFAICSKKMEFSVKIESKEKTKIFNKLKKKYKSEEKIKEIIHSVKIHFAVKGFIDNAPGFYICCDGFNKRNLEQELRNRLGERFIPKKFHLKSSLKSLFGKHNIADKLAENVRRGKKKANLILKEKHFKKLGLL